MHAAGFAATFYRPDDPGTQFSLGDQMFERVHPHAFDRTLQDSPDVLSLYDHDPGIVLGRGGNGTLDLKVTPTGLRYNVELNESDPDARRVYEKVSRGDVKGASFGFKIRDETWTQERDDIIIRTLNDVDLLEVSIVSFPAYKSSSAHARSALAECRAAEVDYDVSDSSRSMSRLFGQSVGLLERRLRKAWDYEERAGRETDPAMRRTYYQVAERELDHLKKQRAILQQAVKRCGISLRIPEVRSLEEDFV